MSMENAPKDAIILPQSMVGGLGNHISNVAGYLADRARREGHSVAIKFNGEWLTVLPPDEQNSMAVRAAAAVTWWQYDIELKREKKWEKKVAQLEGRISELEADLRSQQQGCQATDRTYQSTSSTYHSAGGQGLRHSDLTKNRDAMGNTYLTRPDGSVFDGHDPY